MRFFRRTGLYLQMIYETAISHLFILAASAALTVAGVYALSLTSDYYSIIFEAKDRGLQNKMIVYNMDNVTFPPDVEYAFDFLEEIRSTEGVREADYLNDSGTYFMSEPKFTDPMLLDYSTLVNNGFKFDLTEGRNIDGVNEVLINESASGYVNVGDEIEITLPSYGLYESEEGIGYIDIFRQGEMLTFNVRVVGIVSDDTYLFSGNTRSFPTRLDDPLYRQSERGDFGEFDVVISGDLQTDDGRMIRLSYWDTVLITADSGVSLKELKKALAESLGTTENIVTYDEMLSNYEDQFGGMKATALKYLFSILLVSFMVYASVIFMRFQKRKEEIMSYYLFGATWNWCIVSSVLMFIPAIVTGFFVGAAILVRYKESYFHLSLIDDRFISFSVIAGIGLFYFILIALIMAPVFIALNKTTYKKYRED